ncbi:uncharacterized protein LOC123321987 [Coccinella septempunctata]|uniref:uncharacterized protein LOC123321987 n=1 Tax=Coccinella septempunctata TaxID=41139 RepID=UPI001D084C8F|nr:uncharacterized protein LOC123321987 [Coccinella septempunctata]XP_044765730.1 uncharacterized protein LOC123321987 [Coccinella septempunctata]
MRVSLSSASILICWFWFGPTIASYLPTREIQRGPGEVARHGIAPEPSCEELKAMWRLSKRQSRASELTNEVPTFEDPFTHNIWPPYYATSRSMGGLYIRHRPVYGKMVHSPHTQDERNKAFEELTHNYGRIQQGDPRRKFTTAFRYSGGGNRRPEMGYPTRSGSFQHLRELIRNQKARELQNQRFAEEEAARAEAMKSLTNFGNQRASMYPDMYDMEEQPVPEPEHYMGRQGLIHFPDLLAPSTRHEPVEQYIEDYGYPRIRPKSPDSLLGSSFAYTDYDGFYI